MRTVKRYPTTTGQSWLEMSSYKNCLFHDPKEIKDHYDYIVVGAGYGGYGVADRLAELHPDSSIAVFEAIKIGNGDSGKNAGFIIDVPHNFGDQGNSTFEENEMYYHLNTSIIKRLEKNITESGIKVDWDPCGKYLNCVNESSFKMMEEEARDLDKMKVHYDIFEGEDLARRTGTHYYKKGLYTPGTLLVNPADVLRGLWTVIPKNVEVYECTPVMRIDEESDGCVYLLNGKRVKAKAIAVTAGPFIEEFGVVKRTFCPVLSYGAFTRQFNDREMRVFDGVKPWGCTSGHPAGTTVRLTHDNRIFVRNGFTYASSRTTSHQRIRWSIGKLRRAFENRWPELKNVNFEYVYGGMINMTFNFRPLMMRHSNTVYASASGEGAGVCKTCLCGHYLAEWISGIQSDELHFLQRIATPKKLPPEPLTTIGATGRLWWEEFRAGKEI